MSLDSASSQRDAAAAGHRPTATVQAIGTRWAVAAGHTLASEAAARVLSAGGNAIDAGVAAGFCLGVVHPDMVSVAGVAPILLDTPIARETCADAARYVPAAASVADIARSITDLLADAAARRDLLQRAGTVLPRYDWDLTANDTLTVLEEAALGR